jgi:hypothetical protein
VRQYYVFLLLLQVGMIGVFCALDMFLFYVFWEVMLVPMYFLIGIWGGERRLYAAIKFFLYTLVGSVVMLLGILALYFRSKGLTGFETTGTFDVTQWYTMAASLPLNFQIWVFAAFFLGFAIKVPMFPFHTWLPDAHVQAATAGSVILAGVLLKMGTYGFIRFSLPLLPRGTLWATPVRRDPLHHRDRLRRSGHPRPEGHEEAHRVLLGEPPRLRDAGHVRAEPARPRGQRPPDDQPRPEHGRAVPARRDRLRAPPHQGDRAVRRPRPRDARLRDHHAHHLPGFDGPARC